MNIINNWISPQIKKTTFFRPNKRLSMALGLIFSLLFFGCRDTKGSKIENILELESTTVDEPKALNGIIEVVTNTMDLKVVPRIASGWTTFKYQNKSNETHFFVLEKLPEGKTMADSKVEVIPVFQEGMDLLNEGRTEEGYATFDKLPAWFFEVVFSGGAGLISSGGVAETTVEMFPGIYVMECYVKMPNGRFHSAQGMVSQLEVTDNDNGRTPPKGQIDVSISSADGIVVKGKINRGLNTLAVKFKDQKLHEHFLGHDVHLAKLSEDAKIEQLNSWMNWADPAAFKTPAPEGVIFLGGIQEMQENSVGFFRANFEAGKYALIAEVPDPLSKNMLVTFMVE